MDDPRPRSRLPLHLALFVITFITMSMAGAFLYGFDAYADPFSALKGLPFSLTLISILLFHEMGHYLMSRYHGVKATLPYFIPQPPFADIPIGTFGAFIKMVTPPIDRRSLFDIGAAGPLAGLALAVPAVIFGLKISTVTQGAAEGGVSFGSSVLMEFLGFAVLGVRSGNANILLHPIAYAGWIGLFVTAMNLLPVGQLDGGHIVFALFGKKHLWISRVTLLVILSLGFSRLWYGWLVWGVLLVFIGTRHPPTFDTETTLDLKRKFLGWFMLAVFAVTFVPAPFTIQEPKADEERVAPRRSPPDNEEEGIAL